MISQLPRWPAPASWPDSRIEGAPADLAHRLSELPSATTLPERLFAHHVAADTWDGTGDVFENGPLLGGATRALALGMLKNPNRGDVRLRTFDWFSLNTGVDLAPGTWEVLIEAGYLSQDEYDEAQDAGTFLPLFEALHRDEEYWDFLVPSVGYLPGHRGEETPDGAQAFFSPDTEYSLAFIDGCKSWFGTKRWLEEVGPRLRVGSLVLFQDFRQYTCFWLPMLVGLTGSFAHRMTVDYTCAYEVVNEINPEAYPDDPGEIDRDFFDLIFKRLIEDSDGLSRMALQTQHAAALAYIGELDESARMLDDLLAEPNYAPMRQYLQNARISPTYRPHWGKDSGEIKLPSPSAVYW